MPKKIYILDTNVLMHDPSAIFQFEGVEVGIPAVVLEELDRFKSEGTDRGRNTREVIRELDLAREQGSLQKGVKLDNGAILRVLFPELETVTMPFGLGKEDNIILANALALKNKGYTVIFVSKDINARVKADALGIKSVDYLKEHVSQEEFYQGWIPVAVPAAQLKREFPTVLQELVQEDVLALNQFVLVTSQSNPLNYRVFRYRGGKTFTESHIQNFNWPLQPRNAQQLMAMDLLLDDEIQFVTLLGPAGTGKTFIALLAGLHQVLVQEKYERFLITRPVVPLGRDIGFLPGDIQEKLHIWMLPIYDNMEYIRYAINAAHHEQGAQEQYQRRDRKKHGKKKERTSSLLSLEELIHRGKISLEAITYMRGRSIPFQFILVDEVQNLTPHEVKTLVSRVGQGSKIILAGDPYQIDSPYLDFSSNGLIVASEKFKGQDLFGSVYLPTSERSRLSELATQLL